MVKYSLPMMVLKQILDLGHYERFIDINLGKHSNITTGKIYSTVLKKNVAVII